MHEGEQSKKPVRRVKYFEKNTYPDKKLPVFIDDLRNCDDIPYLHYPDEYDGQESVKLVCTQHYNMFYRPDITLHRQKKITQSWVDFLRSSRLPLKRVQLCSRTPQAIFDALCTQDSIEFLRLKWCAAPDISAIRNLQNLKQLYLGIGTAVTDIKPIAELKNLEALCLDSTTKITDYTCLGDLENLVALDIGGNFQNGAIIDMELDDFLSRLKKLEFLHLGTVRVGNRTFLSEENTASLKYACFRMD